jgi:hypothetical protein
MNRSDRDRLGRVGGWLTPLSSLVLTALIAWTAFSPGMAYGSALGDLPQYFYEYWDLPDGSTAKVNVANGNMIIRAEDLTGPEPQSTFSWVRYYNSMDPYAGSFLGDYWSAGHEFLGLGVGATKAAFGGPGRSLITFTRGSDGTFTAPSWSDASLTTNTAGPAAERYRVVTPSDGMTYVFADTGRLTYREDAAGHRIQKSSPGTWCRSSPR